jgi:hypothetical protein
VQVISKFTDLAKSMMAYEKAHFAAWREGVAGAAATLKQPILARETPGGPPFDVRR